MPTGISSTGFGTGFCRKFGYDNIYVSQKKGSQYQGLSIEQFYKSVSGILPRYKKVYTYGASLGGYCALYYGGVINSSIIAAAPKNSADPFFSKKNYWGNFLHKSLNLIPKTSSSVLVIYDPYREEESRYIDEVVKGIYPSLNEFRLNFSGHKVLNTMRDLGILTEFIKNYISKDKIIVPEYDIRKLPIYYEQKGLYYYKTKNFNKSEFLLKKSISMKPSAEAISFLLRIYIKQNRYDDCFDLLKMKNKLNGKPFISKALYSAFSEEYVKNVYL